MPRFPRFAVVTLRRWPKAWPSRRKPRGKPARRKPDPKIAGEGAGPLQTEINSLQEVLKNQGHPKNLVAVKDSGTPVVASASLTARTLFLPQRTTNSRCSTSARIGFTSKFPDFREGGSGATIWKCPATFPRATRRRARRTPRPRSSMWPAKKTRRFRRLAPLRSKNVKIVSIEQVDENAKDLDPRQRLEFAKSVLNKDLLGSRP